MNCWNRPSSGQNDFYMKKAKILLVSALLVFAAVSCDKGIDAGQEKPVYNPVTQVGRALVEQADQYTEHFGTRAFGALYGDKMQVLSPGVEHTSLIMEMGTGYTVRAQILKIDLNTEGISLNVCLPDKRTNIVSSFPRQTLMEMADVYDAPGARVLAIVNGDFWDNSAGSNNKPRGPIHTNNIIVSDEFNYSEKLPQQALSFAAIDKNGKMLIADAKEYPALKNELREVTGAGLVMLRNGEWCRSTWPQRDPRSAIGYTADNVVYLLTADGRQNFYSYGLTYIEMAYIFKALGCVAAANLDGGGSAQMVVRNPIAKQFVIANRPCNEAGGIAGIERPVINGWMVTVNED